MALPIILAKYVLSGRSGRYSECSYGCRCADIALSVGMVIFIGGVVALNYPDAPTSLSVIAYLTGLMLPPTSFMVRGTTVNEPDVFCPWVALLGIAVAVFAFDYGVVDTRNALAPWACAGLGTFVGNFYALVRGKFPPSDAVLPAKEPVGEIVVLLSVDEPYAVPDWLAFHAFRPGHEAYLDPAAHLGGYYRHMPKQRTNDGLFGRCIAFVRAPYCNCKVIMVKYQLSTGE